MLARFLSSQILGLIGGQALAGLFADRLGLGGLVYALAAPLLVPRLRERGLAVAGTGLIATGLVTLAASPHLVLTAPAMLLMGLGFYMLHGTLQTNATRMAPALRGLAVSAFASCFFLGQALGVWLAGRLADRLGFPALFAASALLVLLLGLLFAYRLERRPEGNRPRSRRLRPATA